MNHALEEGLDFAGHPVSIKKSEGSYYVVCKQVAFLYDDYLLYLEDPSKNILGYNLQGKPCKISSLNGFVTLGCLRDTEDKFNSIVKQVRKTIKNENRNN